MKKILSTKLIALTLALLFIITTLIIIQLQKETTPQEANLFLPEQSFDPSLQASIVQKETSTTLKEFDYKNNNLTDEQLRKRYDYCIKKTQSEFDPNVYELKEMSATQNENKYLTYLLRAQEQYQQEIYTYWKKIPNTPSAYSPTLNCLKQHSAETYLKNCFNPQDKDYNAQIAFFIGKYLRTEQSDAIEYALQNQQLGYEYLGGSPGEHLFLTPTPQDAYFWYCYIADQDKPLSHLFDNLQYKKKTCATEGEFVFTRSGEGPKYCCDRSSDIIPAAQPKTPGVYSSSCVTPSGTIRGVCAKDWYGENKTSHYCGDGICDDKDPYFETQCNCPNDCNSQNTINFAQTSYTFSENTPQAKIKLIRKNTSGGPVQVSYFIRPTNPNPIDTRQDLQILDNGTVTFPQGQKETTITLGIINDTLREPTESFEIILSDPQQEFGENPPQIGQPNTIPVTLQDND